MNKESNSKGKIPTITLKEIETRVIENNKTYKETIERVISEIKNENLNRGRVRPKDPTEARILSQFNRKCDGKDTSEIDDK